MTRSDRMPGALSPDSVPSIDARAESSVLNPPGLAGLMADFARFFAASPIGTALFTDDRRLLVANPRWWQWLPVHPSADRSAVGSAVPSPTMGDCAPLPPQWRRETPVSRGAMGPAGSSAGADGPGRDPARLPGLEECWPVLGESRFRRALASAFGGQGVSLTAPAVGADGRERLLLAVFQPVGAPAGDEAGLAGSAGVGTIDGSGEPAVLITLTDLTAWQRREEGLQRILSERLDQSTRLLVGSEQRFRLLVEASPHWISLVGANGVVATVNPAGLLVLGKASNEVIGAPIWSLFPAPAMALLQDAIAEVRQGRRAAVELRVNPDSAPAPPPFHPADADPMGPDECTAAPSTAQVLAAVFQPIVTGDGPIDRFVAIFTDVTEARRAEEILRRDRDHLERLVEERTDALVQTNLALQAEVTVRGQAEAAMRAARDEAELANRCKSEFLTNISHEIRTPMNSVLGFASLLLRTGLDERQRDYVTTLQSSGRQLMALIDDMLDLAKIEAGRLTLEAIPFSMRRLVEETVATLKPRADEKGLTLSLETASLPGRALVGDPTRFRQVVTNLIGNAIKFTEHGSVKVVGRFVPLTAASRTRPSDAGVAGAGAPASDGIPGRCEIELVVEDTGIGIPRHFIERIFTKFSQADSSTTRRFGGTGLGLAISRQIVEAMGGSIEVESEPGKGARFTVRVPFVLGTDGDAGVPAVAGPPVVQPASALQESPKVKIADMGPAGADAARPGHDLRALVVEDHEESRRFLVQSLIDLGCTVVAVGTGQEALGHCELQGFEVVFMDCRLPDIDGLEVTRLLRLREAIAATGADLQRSRVVAVTAVTVAGHRQRCIEAGMDDYLTKPVRLEDLRRILAEVAVRRAGNREGIERPVGDAG